MNNAIFISGLYLAIAVAVIVGVSSALLNVSTMTIVMRTTLAFATFAFLGWTMEAVLNRTGDQGSELDHGGDPRGAMVDVVLPPTEKD